MILRWFWDDFNRIQYSKVSSIMLVFQISSDSKPFLTLMVIACLAIAQPKDFLFNWTKKDVITIYHLRTLYGVYKAFSCIISLGFFVVSDKHAITKLYILKIF